MRTSIILFFWLFLLPFAAHAEIDPWYATQPSCVIKDADPGRTGNYNAEGIKEFHGIVWKTTVGNNPVNYNPGLLCYQNKIFYGYKAYDEKTGKLVWEVPQHQQYSLTYSAIYKNHLYLAVFMYLPDQDSNMRYIGIEDIDIATKKSKFLNLPIKLNDYEVINMLAYNDVLYISFSSANLVAYSLKDNKILWHTKTKSKYGMKLATDGERVFSEYKNGIAAYDMKTGKRVWSFDRGSVDIIYKDGAVYTESMGGVWALNAKTGKVIWEYSPDNMDERGFAPHYLKVNEASLFFTNANANDKNLYSLDKLTGKLNFKIANLRNILLHKNEIYASEYNYPILIRSTFMLSGKQSSNFKKIEFPISLSYVFPKNDDLIMYSYDSSKNESTLMLIN